MPAVAEPARTTYIVPHWRTIPDEFMVVRAAFQLRTLEECLLAGNDVVELID